MEKEATFFLLSTRFDKYVTYLDAGEGMLGAMGLSFKRRNEERQGKTIQKGGSKAGGALRLSFPCKPSVVIPGSPSARLNRGLKLNNEQWLLRFSVLRETPMTSTINIPFQKTKMSLFPFSPQLEGAEGQKSQDNSDDPETNRHF